MLLNKMMIANKSEKVTCPFNVAHTIERRRLQTHIIKCKRTLPANNDFVQCPFWELHYVKKHELEDHKLNCEHRLLKEANKRMWDNPDASSKFSEPKLVVDPAAQSYVNNESWDDVVGSTFKAEELHASTTHMVTPQGMTKSQRRDYREKERLRLRDLEETTVKTVKTTTTFAQPRIPEIVPPPKKREKIVYDLDDSPTDTSANQLRKNAAPTITGGKERLTNVTGWNNNGSGRKLPFRINSEDEFPSL